MLRLSAGLAERNAVVERVEVVICTLLGRLREHHMLCQQQSAHAHPAAFHGQSGDAPARPLEQEERSLAAAVKSTEGAVQMVCPCPCARLDTTLQRSPSAAHRRITPDAVV